jgi:hypothetical protein
MKCVCGYEGDDFIILGEQMIHEITTYIGPENIYGLKEGEVQVWYRKMISKNQYESGFCFEPKIIGIVEELSGWFIVSYKDAKMGIANGAKQAQILIGGPEPPPNNWELP